MGSRLAARVPPSVLLFVAGTLVPVAIALVAHEPLSARLTGRQYTYVTAATLALVTWTVLTTTDLDRTVIAFASLTIPWAVIVVVVIPVGIVQSPDAFEYLFWRIEDLGIYGGSLTGAGLAAVASDWAADKHYHGGS